MLYKLVQKLEPRRQFLPSSPSDPAFGPDNTEIGDHDVHSNWQVNETFPNVFCTNLVVYYGNPKMEYYAVRRTRCSASMRWCSYRAKTS